MIFADLTNRRTPAAQLATLRALAPEPTSTEPISDDQLTWESLQESRAEEIKHGERVSDWTADRMYGGDAA